MINLSGLNPVKSVTNTKTQAFRHSSFVQKPDTFEHSSNVNFTGSSNRYKQYSKAADSLLATGQNAQLSLDGQLASEGWAGKVADSVSVLWNSNNRAVLVQKDIDKYNEQMGELKASVEDKTFDKKFKEIFGVDYKQSNITKYNKKANEFKIAVTTKAMADIINKKLADDVEVYKKNNGKLQDKVETKFLPYCATGMPPYITVKTPKEEILGNLEKSLVDVVGSKEELENTLKSSGLATEKLSDEQKYNAYGIMADYLMKTSKETSKEVLKGKSIADLKQEYDVSYEKAYGNKNNIQSRVDKYNRSQEIGAAAVRGATRSAISALVMLAAPEAGFAKMVANAATTTGIKILVDGSDKLSNDIEGSLSGKNFTKLVRSASISGAEKMATGILGSVIPGTNTGLEILDEIINQGKSVITDTSMGLVSERLKKGKWATNQIVPRMVLSAVFKNLSPDDACVKELLKVTKGSLNQAMKYTTRDYDVVKSFMVGTKQALEKMDLNNASVAELKKLSKENPEEFLEVMTSTLQQVVEEQKEDEN